MIERIRITVLTITCICIFTDQNQAGVITVENNIVTKATLSDGTTSINVQFVADSYDNVTSGQTKIEIMPWFSNQTKAYTIAVDLRNAINQYESDNSTSLSTNSSYLIAVIQTNETQVNSTLVISSSGSWVEYSNLQIPRTNTIYFDTSLHYAILDTGGNSSVPEPSTAIAMGLLGIVGFAGNRRRRRQVSVA